MLPDADEAEAAVLAVRGLGWAPMALLATMGPCLDGFGARLGLAAEGVFSVSTWEYDPALANVADFESRFEGRFGRRPSWVAAAAYACGEILVRAARRAGNLDREAMFQAMHSLDMMTVAGRFAVDDQGRQIRRSRWSCSGRTAAPTLSGPRPTPGPGPGCRRNTSCPCETSTTA